MLLRSMTAAVCRSAPRLVQTRDRYLPRMAGEKLTDPGLLVAASLGWWWLILGREHICRHKEDRQMYYSSNQVTVCGLGR